VSLLAGLTHQREAGVDVTELCHCGREHDLCHETRFEHTDRLRCRERAIDRTGVRSRGRLEQPGVIKVGLPTRLGDLWPELERQLGTGFAPVVLRARTPARSDGRPSAVAVT
jgi:hypothetical protein